MNRAGSVGGLLLSSVRGSSTTNLAAAYDGNGNVTGLINAADGTICARYNYSPFGDFQRITGPLALQNHFSFSTKFYDQETGLLYYGARYYSPQLGRWIGRDPTSDQVFLNLLLACHNDFINRIDTDGRRDQLLIWTGIFNILGGLAEAFASGCGEEISGGLATAFALAGVLDGGAKASKGFIQLGDGMAAEGDVSEHRKEDLDMQDSVPGIVATEVGGEQVGKIADFLDATIFLANSANSVPLVGWQLKKIVWAEASIDLLEWLDADWEDLNE
jgi:RHS repeat-associated protein